MPPHTYGMPRLFMANLSAVFQAGFGALCARMRLVSVTVRVVGSSSVSALAVLAVSAVLAVLSVLSVRA
ncbi:hypothetical protein GCM10022224_049100 [Nonomuraea antimicrobica]|uniref:Uncharacterized protein n=1 Tax=Nonomuraea antimicrobica TaxID=561173 RepID=A0ABP7C6J6_9ACTN